MPTRQAAGEPAPSPARASGESAAPINPPTGAPEVAGPRAGEPARTPEPAADARPSRPARLPEGQDPKADPKDPDGLRAKADEKQQVPAALEMPQPCDPFPDEPTGGTPKIMITGDSISQGSSGDYTWRYRLYKHLTANGVTPDFVGPYNSLFDNVQDKQSDCSYADSSFSTAHNAVWGRMLLDEKSVIQGKVSAAAPEYMLVLLGINDLAYGMNDPAGAEADLRTFIGNARAAKPDIKLVIGKLLPTGRAQTDSAFASLVSDYNSRISDVASSMSTSTSPIAVADNNADIDPDKDLWDGTHPNAAGDVKIAAAFSDALADEFGLGAAYPRPYPAVPMGPQQPPQLQVTANDDGQGVMSWTASTGANGYKVSERNITKGDQDFHPLPYLLSPNDNPWTNPTLIPGDTYELKIQAFKGIDGGAWSNTVTFTATGEVPSQPPTNLTVTAGDGQATLNWTASPNATGYYIHRRNVTWGDTSFTRLPYPVSGGPWTDGLMINGATYEFKVQAINGAILGGMTEAVSVTPTGPAPGAPTGLSVSAGDGEATLTWTDAEHATGYYVWMKNVAAGETDFTRLPYTVSGGSWTAGSLVNGGEYEFKLQSVNGLVEGGTTGAVSATPTGPAPGAPTGLSAAPGDHQAQLTWNQSTHATGYFVWVRNVTVGETGFTRLPYSVSGGSWTYTNMVNGATYQIKLQAVNGLIEGATSAAVSVSPSGPAPGAPSGLTARSADRGAVLTWDMPSHATCVYILQRNVSVGESGFTKLPYPVCDDTFTLNHLTNGATYQYKVQAYNDYIAGGTSSAVSVVPSGPGAPGPESLTVSSRNGKAILHWSAASHATSYYIWQRQTSPDQESWTRLPYPVAGSTFTVGSLINGARYEFRVQSVDGLEPGGYSNIVSVVPLGPTPRAPGNLSASGSWRGTARLTWSNTSTASGYFVYISDNGSAYTRLPYPVTSGPWTASSLIPGHTYRFRLRAVNGYQEGDYSNVATVTIPLPPKPTGLSAKTHGPYKAQLNWNAVSGADGYHIYYAVNSPGDYSTPSSWTRFAYPVTRTSFTHNYLLSPGVYFYKVVAVKYGVSGPASTPVYMSPIMENRAHYEARMAYLVNRAGSPYSSILVHGGGGGSDSDMFMARAPILNGDWFSNMIGDGRNFSDQLFASSRVSLVWEPKSGRIGAMAYPSCPHALACKDALVFQQTGTSIPKGKECDSILTICGGSYSYNKIGVSGGGGAVFIGFQFPNSYNTVAGLGIPGAIDGTLNVAQQGRTFRATLRADQYPSWEFLRIPHYTTNGMNSVIFFGGRRQRTIEYLCTWCHGQSTVTYQG